MKIDECISILKKDYLARFRSGNLVLSNHYIGQIITNEKYMISAPYIQTNLNPNLEFERIPDLDLYKKSNYVLEMFNSYKLNDIKYNNELSRFIYTVKNIYNKPYTVLHVFIKDFTVYTINNYDFKIVPFDKIEDKEEILKGSLFMVRNFKVSRVEIERRDYEYEEISEKELKSKIYNIKHNGLMNDEEKFKAFCELDKKLYYKE